MTKKYSHRKIPKKVTKKALKEKKDKARASHLLRVYGITLDQYNLLRKKQGYRCFVCRRPEKEFKVRMAVDHDHKTGEIRGLLCSYCNHRVVGRNRDPEVMKRVYEYLSQGTGWFVPKKRPKKKRKRS